MSLEEEQKGGWTFNLAITLFVLAVAYFLSNFQRMMLAVMGDGVVADFGLTDAQFAILGSAIFYPYAILQIPAGLAGDRVPAKVLLFWSCIVSGIGALIFASAGSFSQLVIGRVLTAIGTSFVYIPALAVLRRSFGDARYGAAAGAFMSVSTIATLCAATPLRMLSEVVSRPAIFIGISALTFSSGLGARFFIKDASKKKAANEDAKKNSASPREGLGRSIIAVLSPGVVSMLVIFTFCNGTNMAFTSLWAGRFFTQSIGLTPVQMSYCLMSTAVASFIGNIFFGKLVDKIGVMRTLLGVVACRALCWFAMGSLPEGAGVVLPLAASFASGLFAAGISSSGFATAKLFVPTSRTGTLSGMFNCMIFIGGGLFMQLSAPLMANFAGSAHEKFSSLMFTFAAINIAAGAVVAFVNRRILAR